METYFRYIINHPTDFLNELKKAERNKQIKFSPGHPDFTDLVIVNYTNNQNKSTVWPDLFRVCRSISINIKTGKIEGRSFPKFYNFNPNVYNEKIIAITEKYDGSLIIVFWVEELNKWIATSRNSFESKEAKDAMNLINTKYSESMKYLDKACSYSFELISPNNKQIVDYKDLHILVFLREFETREYRDSNNLNPNTTFTKLNILNINELFKDKEHTLINLQNMNIEGKEGFVAMVEVDGECIMKKVKFLNYNMLHDKNNVIQDDSTITLAHILHIIKLIESGNVDEETIKLIHSNQRNYEIAQECISQKKAIEEEQNKILDDIINEIKNKGNNKIESLVLKEINNNEILKTIYLFRISKKSNKEMNYKPIYKHIIDLH